MDAYVSTKTINFINGLFGKKIKKVSFMDPYEKTKKNSFNNGIFGDYELITRKNDKIKKKVHLHLCHETFFDNLKLDLQKGKRCCFQFPFKTGQCTYFKKSIEDIKVILGDLASLKLGPIKVYHGDIDEDKKKELLNPDKFWKTCKNKCMKER